MAGKSGAAAALVGSATRAQAVAAISKLLASSGVEEARFDARALLFAAAGITHAELVLEPDAPLGEDAAQRLNLYAARRASREPVSRILETRGFWTLDLGVAPGVLDPRADTETVVDLALRLLSNRRNDPLAILDLGSGSGAIVCALLSELPRAFGVAVDVSAPACALTKANLARCGVADRARVVRGRWATAIRSRFDLVVSNPPYVKSGEIDGLAPEVLLHDPRLALDGGDDGLECYREIIRALPCRLAPDGFALVEAGAEQARGIVEIFAEAGLEVEATARDVEGHERAVAARLAKTQA